MSTLNLPPDYTGPGVDQRVAARLLGWSVAKLAAQRAAGTGPRWFKLGDTIRYWPWDVLGFINNGEDQSVGRGSGRGLIIQSGVEPTLTGSHEDDIVDGGLLWCGWPLRRRNEPLAQTETARFLHRSTATLARWRARKEGPAFVVDGGTILYPVPALADYLNYAFVGLRQYVPYQWLASRSMRGGLLISY